MHCNIVFFACAASFSFDARMYKQDIKGSIAHATMLGKQGIIPKEDADLICVTLKEILADIQDNKISFFPFNTIIQTT